MAPNCCRNLLPELNNSVIEYGADTSRAIAKMIYGGAAARYPRIRVIFSHAGGSLPYSAFRFIRHSGRLSPELKTNMPDGFVAMLNKFHYDTANTSNRYAMGSFRELIALSQLMFGTDFRSAMPITMRKRCANAASARRISARSNAKMPTGCGQGSTRPDNDDKRAATGNRGL